jgi:hypothetical protein
MPTRTALATAILASLLFAMPVDAQTVIRLDRPVQGELTATSPRASDDTPYVLYVYRGEAGQRIRVTMDTPAFDAYLAVGTVAAPDCDGDCKTDDDGGDGTNSSLAYTVPASGEVQIRANSINPTDTGPFTLRVQELPKPAPAQVRPAEIDQPVTGSFGDTTSRDDNDKPYDLWSVRGRAGQAVQIRMESSDFDSYVEFGSMVDGQFVGSASDDDGLSGLNARLNVTLDSSGRGVVKATSAGSDARGSYSLRIGEPPAQRPIEIQALTVGEAMRGRLDDNDPFTPETEVRFDVYVIEGRPGQRVVVRMESSDFDPLLNWGTFDGDRFSQEASDDDSGGGTSAQLTVTLDEDGIGRLVATAYGVTSGSYTLSAVSAPRR